MKQLFLFLFIFTSFYATHLSAQCNRPTLSDNPCTAPTFCNTAQLEAFCSSIPSPIIGKTYMKPQGFCGSLESPSWFKFVAQSTSLSLRFTATSCGVDGVQAVILSTTNCSDSASYTAVSNCSNAIGGQPIATLIAPTLIAGNTYYLLVDGYQGAGCNYSIDILAGGTIQTTATPLPVPMVVSGATSVCANATNVTYSVPKMVNVTDYHFILRNTTTNTLIFDGIRTDSFYTVSNFPASGTLSMCVSYKNDCTEGIAKCITITVAASAIVTLPNVYLCPGQFYIAPDGTPVDNSLPPLTDQTQNAVYNKVGAAGCDTTFNVNITSYATRDGSKTMFIKPTERISICGIGVSINTNRCPQLDTVIICRGAAYNGCDSVVNLTLFNAKQTQILSPQNAVLACNTANLGVTQSDTCSSIVHIEKYNWYYQTVATDPLSNTGATGANVTASSPGIYTVIIRDSVYLRGNGGLGYRIFIDTLKTTVTGVGAGSALATPSLINGRTDTTVCQGALTTFKINKVVGATTYNWTFSRNGGSILSGQGDTAIVVRWAGNTSGDTVSVIAQGACSMSAKRSITVVIVNFANLYAGVDTSLCGLASQLNATSSIGGGIWSTVGSPSGSTVNFSNVAAVNTPISVSLGGVYKFAWTEMLNTCTQSDTVQFTFNTPPQYSNVTDSCNVTRTSFIAKFTLTGGTSPFTVRNVATNAIAGSVNAAGIFTSNALIPGSYTLQIRDANGCSPTPNVSVSQTCTSCSTKAGNIDTTTALSVCQGDSARAIYLGGYVSDGNDTLQYVLHTGNPQTGILQRSYKPTFGFRAGMTYETTYFISAIAGDDSTRQVKLTDFCFNATTGVSVVFHRKPTATIALRDSNLCIGTCTVLNYTFTGKTPFTVNTRITDSTTRDSILTGRAAAFSFPICPTINTAYRLVSIRDSFNCADTTLTKVVNARVFQKLTAGTPRAPVTLCSKLDTTITLLSRLTGAILGGTWSETSTPTSTGTAFNRAAGTFRTRNQAAGIYKFGYRVAQAAGSPCSADTATVIIQIFASPTSDAGFDDTIRCNRPQITLGGVNTTLGATITYTWSGGSAGGNLPQTTVTQPGTYYLQVSTGSCTALDSVVVYIDTLAPKAIIQPISQVVTCKNPSVTLNGTRSTPIGSLSYSWAYNGSVFDNNGISQANFGGLYSLIVANNKNGCTNTDTVRIDEDRVLPTINIATPKTLNCKDTVITIDASTSSQGTRFTFKWTTANGGRILADSNTLRPKTKVTGYYQLAILDTLNGCIDSTFRTVNIDTARPRAVAIAIDTIDCNNPTIGLSGRGSTLGATISFLWTARPGHIVSGDNTLNPVADEAGIYFLTVTNSRNACANSDSAIVTRNSQRPSSILLTVKKPTCYGECDASFKVDSVIGGTFPYAYSTDGKVFTTRPLFANQCAGSYHLFVQDAGGCVLDSTFSINQDRQLAISLGNDTILRLGDSLLLRVQANTDSIKNITWSPLEDSTKCPKASFCTQQWVHPITATTYRATLVDKNGCSVQGSINVAIDKKRPVFIPTAFSPNNDGTNEVLMIFGSQVVKIVKTFRIFDRWGELVFSAQNFNTDDPNFGWNGKFRGRDALPGVYIYVINIEYVDKTVDVLQGDFTLIR